MNQKRIIEALAKLELTIEEVFAEDMRSVQLPRISSMLQEAGEGVVVDEYEGIKNGDTITLRDGRSGIVEHIMVGGTLGIPGSRFAIETSETSPGMTIRLVEDGEETEFLLNIQLGDVAL